MFIAVIVLAVGIFVSLFYIYLLKKDIREITKTLIKIKNIDTNTKLVTSTFDKDISQLISIINGVLIKQKELVIISQKSNHEIRQMITNISHDLRTPLTSAKGYIGMLKSNDIPKNKKEEYLEVVERRIQSLNKLLDEFFEYSRIESSEFTLEYENVNVNNLLCDTVAIFYNDFIKKSVKPNIKLPDNSILLNCDKNALERVFQNLIQNFLTHGSGDLSIMLFKQNKKVVIEFSNPTEDLLNTELLFNRFYTGDNSRGAKTTGLGLAIVKSLLTKMGGKIDANIENGIIKFRIYFY